MISVTCACGKRLKADEKNAGRKAKCPTCGAALAFPAGSPRAEAVPSSPVDLRPAEPEGPDDLDRRLRAAPTPAPPPAPEPALAYDQAVARNLGRTSPSLAEPLAYVWADVLAGLIIFLGMAQFVVVEFVVAVTMAAASSAPIMADGSPTPDRTGELLLIAGQSLGLFVGSVLTGSVVRVLLDVGRTQRRLLAEMRAK